VSTDQFALAPHAPAVPIARFAKLAVILGAALASVATAVTLKVIRVQANNVDWVSHTLEVRQKLAVFRATVRGAGSGLRVYLLTHTDSYLDSYREAVTAIPTELHELQQLTVDNPVQQVNLAKLSPLIDERLQRLDAYLHGQEATVAWLDETKRNLDDFGRAADVVDQEEVRLLDLRKQTAHRGQTLAELVSSLGLVLSLLLVGLGWSLQRVELKRDAELVKLLHVGSLVSNNSSDFREALQACLEQICQVTGWPGGHVHLVDGRRLISSGIWHLPLDRDLHGLVQKLESFRAPLEIGIAKQLISLKRPGWVKLGTSRGEADNQVRDAVAEAGFGGILVLPVVANGQAIALMEFFLDKITAPDTTLLEAMATIGSQLGRVFERAQVLALHEQHSQEVQALSITDELTGLLNRRGFIALASQQLKISSRRKERCCLFFMDMDGLKAINDELGHAEGDLALRRLADVLLRSFRQADLVARLGGDEFVALAADTTEVVRISDRIQENLSEIQVGEAVRLPVAVSIGVTWIEPGKELKIEEALADADREMYVRKRERRGSKPPKTTPPVEVV